MYQGQIIDTHMHLWDRSNGYEWLPTTAEGKLNYDFLMEDYFKLSKNQKIAKMVFVECGGFPEDPVLETKWVQKQADQYGAPQGIIAFAPLHSPNIKQILRGHAECANLRGIRMPLNFVPGGFGANRDDYMIDPAWRRGYAMLAEHELLFEMQIYDHQIPMACQLTEDYPDTRIVLEHLGWPFKIDSLTNWKEHLIRLAQFPQVFLKLSCLGWIFQTKQKDAMISLIREAVEIFGSNRCVVGSNCPPDLIYLSFDEIFEIFKLALINYPESEQRAIFHDNAKRIYRI